MTSRSNVPSLPVRSFQICVGCAGCGSGLDLSASENDVASAGSATATARAGASARARAARSLRDMVSPPTQMWLSHVYTPDRPLRLARGPKILARRGALTNTSRAEQGLDVAHERRRRGYPEPVVEPEHARRRPARQLQMDLDPARVRRKDLAQLVDHRRRAPRGGQRDYDRTAGTLGEVGNGDLHRDDLWRVVATVDPPADEEHGVLGE